MAKKVEPLVDEGFRVSLVDAPLCVQIVDIYLNRAVGYYFSQQGIYVVPNIRWGDERTYTSDYLGEKVAFQ